MSLFRRVFGKDQKKDKVVDTSAPQGVFIAGGEDDTVILDQYALGDEYDDATALLGAGEAGKPVAVITSRGSGRMMNIDKDVFSVGRKVGEVDFLVDESTVVSRRHVEILRESDGFYIRDLDSKNKSYLNGMQLEPYQNTKLEGGCVIKLADIEFDFSVM
jgi:pSer/pThr/pTyr-binding forkhead associated (FHA) protein